MFSLRKSRFNYISHDRLALEAFEDGPCPVPPELAIEIISPGQTFGATVEKAKAFLQNFWSSYKLQ
jgi:Uma2 family endonuclease